MTPDDFPHPEEWQADEPAPDRELTALKVCAGLLFAGAGAWAIWRIFA